MIFLFVYVYGLLCPLPLNLCKIHFDFPCFVASFISLFILVVGLGAELLGG